MHPNLNQDLPAFRQADLFREAERARLAALVGETAERRPHRGLRLRNRIWALPGRRSILGAS